MESAHNSIVSWGIWLAWNTSLFENKEYPTVKVSQQTLALLQFYKVTPSLRTTRLILNESINKQKPWGYFDGACQGPNNLCGLGFILHFSEAHYIYGKAKLGQGSNNTAEFSALFASLRLAVRKNVT
jgi:hypothetical protein